MRPSTTIRERIQRITRFARHDRFLALADQATVSAANLLTTIIIGRACTKGELGLFAAGFSIVMLSLSIQRATIITPYTVLTPRMNESDRRSYRGSALLQHVGLVVFLGIALLIAGFLTLKLSQNQELGRLIVTLAVAVGLILFREHARLTSIADLAYRRAFIIDATAALIQISAITAMALGGNLSARTAFIAAGSASGLVAFCWFASSWNHMSLGLRNAAGNMARAWFFGRWLFASGLLAQINLTVYPWLIIAIHGADEAGVWAACVGAVALYNPVMLALYNETAPRIAHDYAEGGVDSLRNSVLRSMRLLTLSALPFLAALVFFGGDLVTLMYGSKYAGNESVVTLLALAAIAVSCGYAFPNGLFALDRPDLDFAGNVVSAVILGVFGVFLTSRFGIAGAALGVLVANSLAESTKAFFFLRALKKVLS